jgi:BclB C-terminal domain-containing protein
MKFLYFILSLLLTTMVAFSQQNTITYQGRLFDNGGNPINQTNATMTFAIYDAVSAGNLLWPNSGTVSKSVNVSDGLYSVILGSGIMDDIVFNAEAFKNKTPYIEVTVNGTTLQRTQITNVPFSLLSSTTSNISGGTSGSIPYQSAAGTTGMLPKGTAGQVLTMNAGATAPEWKTPTGGASGSAIIPFASGTPISMTASPTGQSVNVALVGFGSNYSTTLSGANLDLTGSGGNNINQAFIAPNDGKITSMSAFISTSVAYTLIGSTVTITAQLYRSSTPDNILTPIPGAIVTFAPAFTGIIAAGEVASGTTTGLNIPITAGTRVALVYSITSAGIPLSNPITVYASAGVKIE